MSRKDKITQKKAAFYVLWERYQKNPEEFVPAWQFVGEILIKELGIYFLMSYKCPTNGLEIYFDNPGLIERRFATGKSGARFYEYRIAPNPSMTKIKDESLLEFYKEIKRAQPQL